MSDSNRPATKGDVRILILIVVFCLAMNVIFTLGVGGVVATRIEERIAAPCQQK